GDTNGIRDIFIHDRLSGVTERVSERIGGDSSPAIGNASVGGLNPAISSDGRFVAFFGLFPAIPYIHDRLTGAETPAPLAGGGCNLIGGRLEASLALSADGRSVAAEANCTILQERHIEVGGPRPSDQPA